MSITLIAILIFFGIVLILVELLLFPGVGIAGIAGIGFFFYAVISAYERSENYGHLVLFLSVSICILAIAYALKANTWKKLSLKESADGKLQEYEDGKLNVGDEGITISRLANIGKAEINDTKYEVESIEGYIDENTKIVVTALKRGKIYVKQIN
jgi:membrane-bound ClpP family serine protease